MSSARLYQRNGHYWIDIRQGGARKREPLHTQDPAAARAMLAAVLERLEREDCPESMTVAEAISGYLEHEHGERERGASRPLAVSTLTVQEARLRGTVSSLWGEMTLHGIDVGAVSAGVERLQGEGYADKSISNVLDDLSAVIRWAMRRGYLQANPVASWRSLQGERRVKAAVHEPDFRALTREEMGRLLEAAAGGAYFGIILAAADTGLRVGELRAVAWEDVQLGTGREDRSRSIWVHQSHPTNGLRGESTKTGRSRRVQLSWRLREWLREERLRRMEAKLQEPSGPIFGAFDNANVRASLHRLCRKAGLAQAGLLDLRHSWASSMLTLGFDLEYIARQLGHSPQTCRAHYARYLGNGEYTPPPVLEAWMVPADVLCLDAEAQKGTNQARSDAK